VKIKTGGKETLRDSPDSTKLTLVGSLNAVMELRTPYRQKLSIPAEQLLQQQE